MSWTARPEAPGRTEGGIVLNYRRSIYNGPARSGPAVARDPCDYKGTASFHVHAAVDADGLSRDVGCGGRRQESHDAGDVLGGTEPPQRDLAG